MTSAPLRTADGLGWAILVLGIAFVLLTAVSAVATPAGESPPPSLFSYLYSLWIAIGLLAGPLAFHRRRWWAWDLSVAMVLLIWMFAPFLFAGRIAPAGGSPGGAAWAAGLVVLVLFYGVPIPAATAVLLHNDVRGAFPHPLPPAPRVIAAYLVASAPLHLLQALSPDPQLLFGIAPPRWGTVLWALSNAAGHSLAGLSLYRGHRLARPAALLVAGLVCVQAIAGLLHPGLSSLSPDFPYPLVGNGVNLTFGFAVVAIILPFRPPAPETPGPPIPEDLPEIGR